LRAVDIARQKQEEKVRQRVTRLQLRFMRPHSATDKTMPQSEVNGLFLFVCLFVFQFAILARP
jgi:hypothetical protein